MQHRSNYDGVVRIVEPKAHLPHLPAREPEAAIIVVIKDALRTERPRGGCLFLDATETPLEAESF